MKLRWVLLGSSVMAAALLGAVLVASEPAAAQTEDPLWDNGYCLGCHDVDGFEMTLPSGEVLPLQVEREVFEDSVHGELGLSCVLCHSDITAYPHNPIGVETAREFTIQTYATCTTCHDAQYSQSHDNVHAQALAAGILDAPVCADCHGDHDIQHPGTRAEAIQDTCQNCHFEIYNIYADSVHGAALFEEGNADVPTCTDCHGVHEVAGPHEQGFHLFSPQICAECHRDEELMAKYDISTAVFDTYVADFHGTTVLLFEDLFPDQETNKPVCIDCHGVHNIAAASDANSQVFQENLLATCQRCHPDATENFPASWLSHYKPSTDSAPLVYFVTLFYQIIIPVGIGLALIWVILDFIRIRVDKRRAAANA